MRAADLFEEGMIPAEIARQVGVTHQIVSEWRKVWWQAEGGPQAIETDIYELSDVAAGNMIAGPAIIESVATTFAIPPGRSARLDRHQIFHLEAR